MNQIVRTSRIVQQRLLPRLQTLAHVRCASGRPMNTIIKFVPQQEAWIIERMGKFHRELLPGINFLLPILDKVKYVQSLKEIAIDIPSQTAITIDNVTLGIDGVLYLRVIDAYKASYGVEDPEYAVTQIAQTTMRSEIGKITLDHVFKERESLNQHIVEAINNAAAAWGIRCLRYEIKDITLPNRVKEAMQMQVEAERKKRAKILQSEGQRESEINIAEGMKRSKILASEALKTEAINKATGEAAAIIAKAEARTTGLKLVAGALTEQQGGNAASFNVAEQYISAFGNLAKKSNTVLLPTNTGDITGMVTQAMAIYNNLSHTQQMQSGTEREADDVEEEDQPAKQHAVDIQQLTDEIAHEIDASLALDDDKEGK